MIRPVFTLMFMWCLAVLAPAQDLHYSQFYHNPMHLNPALTGVFRGNLRAAGLYRSQWTSVPVSYRTYAGAVDAKVLSPGSGNTLSAGFLVQHDKAGDAGMTWTQLGLAVSAAHALDEWNSLSVGIGLGLAQRTFDMSKLTFQNQWLNDAFDASLPTKENFNRSSGLSPTLSAGLNWHFAQADTRTTADAGAGVFHLNRPKISFSDSPVERLPFRIAVSINTAVQLNEFFDLVVFGVAQRMGTAQEIIAGGGPKLWLVPNEKALQFTLASRIGDALIPALQYEWGAWTVGVSYDWNTSGFETATNGRGGVEIAVVYRVLPVPPVKTFKSCPVF